MVRIRMAWGTLERSAIQLWIEWPLMGRILPPELQADGRETEMDLVNEPWIPMKGNGLVSLNSAFAEGDGISDLGVTPPERIAIMRLLICIAQAALDGPKDELDWTLCRERIGPAGVDYLKSHKQSFQLYGDRPFLQAPEIRGNQPNALTDKLNPALSSKNNLTLFDHEANPDGRHHADSDLVRWLLVHQGFSVCGTSEQTIWNGQKTAKTVRYSPLISGSPAHTFLLGENLTESIWLNLLTQEQVSLLPNGKWGKPVWELPPPHKKGEAADNATRTYLGRLVPFSRLILLEPGSPHCILGEALTYEGLPSYREPSVTVVANENDVFPLRLDPAKHIWRELDSVLRLSGRYDLGAAPALYHLLSLEQDLRITVWVGGIATKRRAVAKIDDSAEWSFQIPSLGLDSSFIAYYETGLQQADKLASRLYKAVEHYLRSVSPRRDKKEIRACIRSAVAGFWGRLDSVSDQLLQIAVSEGDLDKWSQTAFRDAIEAYRLSCPDGNARRIRAHVEGMEILRGVA